MSDKKLARHLLPQIPGDKLGEFCSYMESKGVPYTACQKPAKELRAIQAEVNREKIEKFKEDPEALKKPIIISKTGWILDGHHRWLAAKELDPNMPLNCLKFECTINELVALGHKFAPSFTKTVEEASTYSKQLWQMQQRRGETPEQFELIVRKTLRPY